MVRIIIYRDTYVAYVDLRISGLCARVHDWHANYYVHNYTYPGRRILAYNTSASIIISKLPLKTAIMAEEVGVDSDVFNKYVVLPDKIRKELIKWFNDSNKVTILLTGRTGVGKSTLVNSLIGNKVAKEGETLKPETSEVTGHKQQIRDVEVTVWDSPGLQDGTGNEGRYLADMKRKCKDVDLCVYCVSLKETRFTEGCDDIIAMKKLTDTFSMRFLC